MHHNMTKQFQCTYKVEHSKTNCTRPITMNKYGKNNKNFWIETNFCKNNRIIHMTLVLH